MRYRSIVIRQVLVATALLASALTAVAADANRAIEEVLVAAQQAKRGINLYVNGQVIGGAVVRIESGAFVELRNQEFSRIVVRLERIDGVAMP
jgi:murein endopeptidase